MRKKDLVPVNSRKITLLQKSGIAGLCALLPLMIGHGCGSDLKLKDQLSASSVGTSRMLNTEFVPLAKTQTVSLAYSKQVLDNMVACLGLERASTSTEREWQERKGSLSEFGFTTEVTSPMLMAVVAIAGEACADLIDRESQLLPEQRRIFKEADLSESGVAAGFREMENMTRRLTRSCWQREPTQGEVSEIVTAVEQAVFSDPNVENASQKGMLMACTAVLSSLESIQL